MVFKRFALAGTVLAMVAACSIALAQAPGGPGGGFGGRAGFGRPVSGFVASASETSIQVRPVGGGDTVTLSISPETVITKTRTLAVKDLKVGDEVRVMGRPSGQDENAPVDAMMISVGAAPGGMFGGMGRRGGNAGAPGAGPGGGAAGARGGFRGGVSGKIKSVGDNSIVVTTDSGDRTVNISANTRIEATDTVKATDLKAGDYVMAFGQTNDSGQTTARMIRVSEPPSGQMVSGLVSGKDASWVEVTPRFGGTKTRATVVPATVVLRATKIESTDLKAGDRVTIFARPVQNGDEMMAVAVLTGEPIPANALGGGMMGPGGFGGFGGGFGGMRGGAQGGPGGGMPGQGGQGGQGRGAGAGAGMRAARPITGEIVSVSPLSVKVGENTINLRTSGQTVMLKLAKAGIDTAKTDEPAVVIGKPSASGGVEASVVLLGVRPADLGRVAPGAGGGAGGPGDTNAPPPPPTTGV